MQLPEIKFHNSVVTLPDFKDEPVFYDIESGGLYTEPRLFQFYCPNIDEAIHIVDVAPSGYEDFDYEIELERAKRYIPTIWTIAYNSSYDHGTLNISPKKTDDLFYLVKSAYPEYQRFGLAEVTGKYPTTKGLYGDMDKKALQKAGFKPGAYLSSEQITYAATDVLALALLWEDDKIQRVREHNLSYKVDMESQRLALIYQQNPHIVDRDMRDKMLIEAQLEVDHYKALLPATLNVNSYVQVRKHLNTTESDKTALAEMATSNHPLAKDADAIRNLKKFTKRVSYLTKLKYDTMVTKFNAAGAVSGRFTSSGGDLNNGFNAQQIPRMFQKIFKQPATIDGIDTVVIGADYATLELRLAAAIFEDHTMYKQLKNGEDIHTTMAQVVTGKEMAPDGKLIDTIDGKYEYLTTEDRSKAKLTNFGFVFGMSAVAFVNYAMTSYGLRYTIEEAKKLRGKYFGMYKDIARYHNWIWNNYKKSGFVVETALGRRMKPKLGTDAINLPVQGTGAETTKLGLAELVKRDNEALKYIFSVVHDAIYLRVPREEVDYWSKVLEESMLEGWKQISQRPLMKFNDIPIMADVEVIL